MWGYVGCPRRQRRALFARPRAAEQGCHKQNPCQVAPNGHCAQSLVRITIFLQRSPFLNGAVEAECFYYQVLQCLRTPNFRGAGVCADSANANSIAEECYMHVLLHSIQRLEFCKGSELGRGTADYTPLNILASGTALGRAPAVLQ